jgi:hypothetical protein
VINYLYAATTAKLNTIIVVQMNAVILQIKDPDIMVK